MTKTIFVKVPEPKKGDGKKLAGEEPRVCPIAAADNPHGGNMMLRPAGFLEDLDASVGTTEGPVEVFDSPSIRRRVRSGDLEVAAAPAAKPAPKTKEG